jgi:hypothetical protein
MKLKQYIKKVLREDVSIKNKIQNMVLKKGWDETAEIFGDDETLMEYGYNNDPYEYLNSLPKLELVKSQDKPTRVLLLKDENGKTIFMYDDIFEELYYPYTLIYEVLKDKFKLSWHQINSLVKEFVSQYGIKPNEIFFQHDKQIAEIN